MQHYLACDRVRIDGITVFNRNNYNKDALDLDGCHNVTVSNMIADSDDDGSLSKAPRRASVKTSRSATVDFKPPATP